MVRFEMGLTADTEQNLLENARVLVLSLILHVIDRACRLLSILRKNTLFITFLLLTL